MHFGEIIKKHTICQIISSLVISNVLQGLQELMLYLTIHKQLSWMVNTFGKLYALQFWLKIKGGMTRTVRIFSMIHNWPSSVLRSNCCLHYPSTSPAKTETML